MQRTGRNLPHRLAWILGLIALACALTALIIALNGEQPISYQYAEFVFSQI